MKKLVLGLWLLARVCIAEQPVEPSEIESQWANLHFVGASLRQEKTPNESVVHVMDWGSGTWEVSQWVACAESACELVTNASSFFLHLFLRETAQALVNRHWTRPGMMLANAQLQYEPIRSFLTLGSMEAPEDQREEWERILFQEFRLTARQLHGLALAPGGVVLRDQIISEILSVFPWRAKFRQLLSFLKQMDQTGLSRGERGELAATFALLEERSRETEDYSGATTIGMVYGVTVGQYFLFVPIFAAQTLTVLGCPGVCALSAPVNIPLSYLRTRTRGLNYAIEYVLRRWREDLQKRYGCPYLIASSG